MLTSTNRRRRSEVRFPALHLVGWGMALMAASPLTAGLGSHVLAAPRPSIAMHGDPALPPNFTALPYVDPSAPQGGSLALSALQSFDNVNPFNIRGAAAAGVNTLVFETLMRRSADEPFSLYPLVADTIDAPDDRSWVEFHIDPRAHFSDGQSVTADDIAFSWQILKDNRPQVRQSYAKVASVQVEDRQTVRFVFKAPDRELPLVLALMTVLPRHAIDPAAFGQSTLKPMIGSGPYVFDQIRPGESISFRKDPAWWGQGLPSNRGLYNVGVVRYDYYRDANAMFEAFKTGLTDLRTEGDAGRWATQYDFPAVVQGRVVRDQIATEAPKGMNAFVFNTRRAQFRDPRVRAALAMLFDFEWANRNLYYGLYARTCGFFEGSALSSCGRPANAAESTLLAPFADAVEPDVMQGRWRPTVSDGSGRDRAVARQAVAELAAAGWRTRDGVMTEERTSQPLAFEILVTSKDQERLALNYVANLRRIGVQAVVRLVDNVQYQKRQQGFDFDMLQVLWPATASPGNEQSFRWGSGAATAQGSFNWAGVSSPAADAMIEALLAARSQEDFESAVRALDRVLISGHYVVPLFNAPTTWMARWSKIGRPARTPRIGTPITGAPLESYWRITP